MESETALFDEEKKGTRKREMSYVLFHRGLQCRFVCMCTCVSGNMYVCVCVRFWFCSACIRCDAGKIFTFSRKFTNRESLFKIINLVPIRLLAGRLGEDIKSFLIEMIWVLLKSSESHFRVTIHEFYGVKKEKGFKISEMYRWNLHSVFPWKEHGNILLHLLVQKNIYIENLNQRIRLLSLDL